MSTLSPSEYQLCAQLQITEISGGPDIRRSTRILSFLRIFFREILYILRGEKNLTRKFTHFSVIVGTPLL
ncbi:hypothetical protein BYT27DRAFT_7183910 [Phlegmacium glaucopus]|nr:hypothetical protein BYT27DRAFT_7183910 [Phlegmacium glaucopus]